MGSEARPGWQLVSREPHLLPVREESRPSALRQLGAGTSLSPRRVNLRGEGDRSSRRRAERGSDRCFASPKASTCADPHVVAQRRTAPAGLNATEPRHSVPRRHSMPAVRDGGAGLHKAASDRLDLELSSTRIGESPCAKRSPTSTVLRVRPWASLVISMSRAQEIAEVPIAKASHDALACQPHGCLISAPRRIVHKRTPGRAAKCPGERRGERKPARRRRRRIRRFVGNQTRPKEIKHATRW